MPKDSFVYLRFKDAFRVARVIIIEFLQLSDLSVKECRIVKTRFS